MNPEQLRAFTTPANVTPTDPIASHVQENDVSNKISNDLDLITQKLAEEIIDLKNSLGNNKREISNSKKPSENTGLQSLISFFNKDENENEEKKEKTLIEDNIIEKHDQLQEIEKLKDELKGKSPKFIEGFLSTYKTGFNDVLKPIQETLNTIKEKNNLEIEKENSLKLLSNTEELYNNLKTKQSNINNVTEKLNGNPITVDSLKNFEWENPIKNDLYHNTTPLKNLNRSKIELYEAIAQDAKLADKHIKVTSNLEQINDFAIEDTSVKEKIQNFDTSLNEIKEQIKNSTNPENLNELKEKLNQHTELINGAQKSFNNKENDIKQALTKNINNAANEITSPKKVKTNSKTGQIMLKTLKALNIYDASQEQLNTQIKDPSINTVNDTKNIPHYFMDGANKDNNIVNQNKLRLKINQNKKSVTKNKVQDVSAYANLKNAQSELNKKIQNSKTLNGTNQKNSEIKEKAVDIKSSLDITMSQINEKRELLEAVNPESKKPWIIPEEKNNNLVSFENAVKGMTNKVEESAKSIYKDLYDDLQKTNLAGNNLQHREYDKNGLAVNRVISKGVMSLQDTELLINDLKNIANTMNAEVETARDNIEKVDAYFNLAKVTTNLGLSSSANSIDVADVVDGINNLSTLGSTQHLDKIKRNINTALENATIRKEQLESIVEKGKLGQAQIYGYEEVFLPQINSSEFFENHNSPNYEDKMKGVFAARNFKNTANQITVQGKLDRDRTKGETQRDKTVNDFIDSLTQQMTGGNSEKLAKIVAKANTRLGKPKSNTQKNGARGVRR